MQPQFPRVTILRNILIAFSVATVGMTRPATAEPENLQAIRFESRVIDPLAGEICYSVALADVDGDGADRDRERRHTCGQVESRSSSLDLFSEP